MYIMFEFCRLRCEYAELHAPSSFGLNELLPSCSHIMYTRCITSVKIIFENIKNRNRNRYNFNLNELYTGWLVT